MLRAPSLLLLLALLGPSCGPPGDAPSGGAPPDLLLVTVDTLRADFLGAYGYPRGATPVMDALGAAGAVFERHHSTSSATAPAHASMLTGLHLGGHGVRKNGWPLPDDLDYLPELLQQAGYRTGASIGAKLLGTKSGFTRGFEFFDQNFGKQVAKPPEPSGKAERYAEAVIDGALAWLEADEERPTFLWVHLYDPHQPYAPPADSGFEADLKSPFYGERIEVSPISPRHVLTRMHATYEAELRYTDSQLGRLLAAWNARVKDAPNLVVLTSDHGEALGEHLLYGHGFFLYEEQLQVPLLMRFGGVIPPGTRIESVSSTVDLPATILDLLGLEAPAGLGGASLRPRLADPTAGPAVAFAERRDFSDFDLANNPRIVAIRERTQGRPQAAIGRKCSLVHGHWKLIWSETGLHELYDLEADPGEHRNLFQNQRERGQQMLEDLQPWLQLEQRIPPLGDQTIDAETAETLKALGY